MRAPPRAAAYRQPWPDPAVVPGFGVAEIGEDLRRKAFPLPKAIQHFLPNPRGSLAQDGVGPNVESHLGSEDRAGHGPGDGFEYISPPPGVLALAEVTASPSYAIQTKERQRQRQVPVERAQR